MRAARAMLLGLACWTLSAHGLAGQAPAPGAPMDAEATYARAERVLLTNAPASSALDWAERVIGRMIADRPKRSTALIRQILERGSWEARRSLARALAIAPAHGEILARLTSDRTWSVRAAAVRSVVLARPAAATPALLTAASDPMWSVRWAAIRGLTALPTDAQTAEQRTASSAACVAALNDVDDHVRREAVRALVLRPTPLALKAYEALIKDPEETVRARLGAARAILTLHRDTQDATTKAKLLAAIDSLRTASDLNARVIAARMAQRTGAFGEVRPGVVADTLTAWSTADPAVRAVAEDVAAALDPTCGLTALDHLIATPTHPAIRSDEIARWIVRHLHRAAAIPTLALRLASPGTAPALRLVLVRALPAIGRDGPRDYLLRTYPALRRHAERALAKNKPDQTRSMRNATFVALAATAPFDGWAEVVRGALDDPSLSVRQAAARHWIGTAGIARPYDLLASLLSTKTSDYFGRNFLRTVARRRDEAAFSFLIGLAQGTYTDRAKLRYKGLNALTSTTWAPAFAVRLTEWLRRRLSTERDDSGRVRMLRMLYNLDRDDALPLLAETALNPNEREVVRQHAIDRLGYSGRPSAAVPLRKLLDRENTPPPLRRAALKRLIKLAQPEDVDRMLAVLPQGPESMRLAALVALERLRPKQALTAVRALTRNGLVDSQNRARGLRIVAAIAGADVVDELFDRMQTEVLSEMRIGALDALSLLPAEAYSERLLAYVTKLRNGRASDSAMADRFAEIIGELGRTTDDHVTRFLIDFLLEGAARPDQPAPLENRREAPLLVRARTALLGHNPIRVRRLLRERIASSLAAGPGRGVREAFFANLASTFSHPSRWKSWGSIAVDLVDPILATAPHGSRRDYGALQLVGNAKLARGDFAGAATAFSRLHRVAALGDYPHLLGPSPSLTDDAVHRYFVIAEIARGAADEDGDAGWARVRGAVAQLPHDAETVLIAAEAAAVSGRDLAWAVERLDAIDRRLAGHDGAAATRFALGVKLLEAGDRPLAAAQFRWALAVRRDLRDRFATHPTVRAKLEPDARRAILDSTR